jgi:hypothetical protein
MTAGAGLAANARSNRSSASKRSVSSLMTSARQSGPAFVVGQHHGADAVRPAGLLVAGRRHLDHHLVEGLAREDALHRVLAGGQVVTVAVAQLETPPVLGHRAAEVLHPAYAVHGKGRRVGPSDGLVRLDQDDAVVERRDELLQLVVIGFVVQRGALGHRSPFGRGGASIHRAARGGLQAARSHRALAAA